MEGEIELNSSELLVKEAKQNQTRKILDIAKEAKDKEEIIKEIKKLLENK